MSPKKVAEASSEQKSVDWIGKLPIIASILFLINVTCIVTLKISWLGSFAVFLLIILSFLNFLVGVFGFLAIISQFITKKKDPQKIWIELGVFLFAFVVIWAIMFYVA